MNQADIHALVQTYAKGQASTDTMGIFFDEALEGLAKSAAAPLVDCELFDITSGTVEYSFPTNAIKILGLFYEGTELPFSDGREISLYSNSWNDDVGEPITYLLHQQDARTFRLYPISTGTTISTGGAEPLGADYPAFTAGAMLYTAKRTTGISDWLALPITFNILAREFAYPSAHQDNEFADTCRQLSAFLMQLAGLGDFRIRGM